MQAPGVQQRLASELIEKAGKSLDGKISFSRVSLQAPGSFTVKDLLILDDNPYLEDEFGLGYAPSDTILYARELYGTISAKALLSSRSIHFNRIHVKGVVANVINEPSREFKSNIARFIKSKAMPKTDSVAAPVVGIGRILAEDVHFRLVNFRKPKSDKVQKGGINYADLDAHADYISGGGFKYKDGFVTSWCDGAEIKEKSGADLIIRQGRCKVGPHGDTDVWDLVFNDGWSDMKVKHYAMYNSCPKAFKHFTDQVLMKASVSSGSVLSSKTISTFARGALIDKDFLLNIDKLEAEGFVNDFNVSKLKITDAYEGVEADLCAAITGVSISRNMMLDARIDKLRFSTRQAGNLLGRLVPGKIPDITSIAPGQPLVFSGTAKGFLNDFKAKGRLQVAKGRAEADLRIRHLADRSAGTGIEGTIHTKELGVGKISGKSFLGNLTSDAALKAVLDNGNTRINLDSLIVDKLGLLGYDYTGIAAKGVYSDNAFDGKIICADHNLNFIFQGIFNTSPRTKNALYKFSANLGYADLAALNLDKRGGISKVSGQIITNFMKTPDGDLLGDIAVQELTLESDTGVKPIGDIYIGSHSNGNINRAQIESRFLDAGYVGNRSITDIIKDIQTVTTRRELPSLYSRKDKDSGSDKGQYDISVAFHDSRDLLSFIKPGLYIADSTGIELRMDGKGRLNAKVNSPRLAYRTNYLKALDLSLDNLGESVNLTLLTDEMKVGSIGFCNSAFTAYANDDDFFTSFHYDNIVGIDNMGELYLSGSLNRDSGDTLTVNAKPLSSYVRFENSQWDLAESEIFYRAGEARFSDFLLKNGTQSIAINGGISSSLTDTLRLNIDNVDLETIRLLTGKDFGLSGYASGRAMLSSPIKGDARAFLNLNCDSLQVNSENAGSLRMAAVWDKKSDKLNAYLRNVTPGGDALNLKAGYGLSDKSVSIRAVTDSLSLSLFAPFVSGFMDELGGYLSGTVNIGGRLDSLSVSGSDNRLDNVRMKIGYTGVPYVLNGPFHIDGNGLFFDNISVTDDEGGLGVLGGGLRYDNLKDFNLDAILRLSRLKLMGSGNRDGSIYGELFASGDIRVSGPFDGLMVNADLSTDKAGSLHISLDNASSASVGDLLTFTDHSESYIDPYELMLMEMMQEEEVRQKARRSNFEARARIQATPDVEAVLELDNSGDNFLTARGTGLISIDLAPSRNLMDIGGDYNISNGKYHFAIPGIVTKNFNINSGSSIKFGGDILDSELDIDATYSLRTNINKLLADTTAVATRRLVNCGIGITGRLSSPKLNFSIDIPDLDPTTKSEVESALNTEDKVQKQFLSLVIAGSFLQNEQSGIVNNSNVVFSNVSELVSRQLSNLLARMDIPLDLGVGYQQNSSGTDLYDVSVSTELFDNRVEVHGSVANRQYSNTTNPNGDVVGDLDIDIKLDKPGQLRLNLFSHSADEYTSYLDYSQRNGVGITYQKEFNKWKDFWRSLFRRKKRMSLEELQKARPAAEEEKKTIEISADD